MKNEVNHPFNEQFIKPIADKVIEVQPPSKLESHEQKTQRICAQLRASLRDYANFFVRAQELLTEAGFTFPEIDPTVEERFPKLILDMIEKGEGMQDLLKLSEEHLAQIYAIASRHYEQKAYADARDIFLLLATLCPDQGIFYAGLGMVEQQSGDYETAARFYALAAALNPEDPSIYLYAAHCLHLQNRTDEATQLLNALVETISNHPDEQKLKKQIDQLKRSWKLSVQPPRRLGGHS